MSEFSNCYYLLTKSVAEALELATSVGKRCAILPPGPRWTPLLFDSRNDYCADPEITLHNKGLLLHYTFGCGCCLRVFSGPLEVGTIECKWETPDLLFGPSGEIVLDDTGQPVLVWPRGFDAQCLVEQGLVTEESAQNLREICSVGAYPAPDKKYVIAESLGLTNYTNFPVGILSLPPDELLAELPAGTVLVGYR